MTRKRVDVGNPFHEVWETGYMKWPWYAKFLLMFKRGKWWGEKDDVQLKVKNLFGVQYVVATRGFPNPRREGRDEK